MEYRIDDIIRPREELKQMKSEVETLINRQTVNTFDPQKVEKDASRRQPVENKSE